MASKRVPMSPGPNLAPLRDAVVIPQRESRILIKEEPLKRRKKAKRRSTKPSAKQLSYLQVLCDKLGRRYVEPKTRQGAQAAISSAKAKLELQLPDLKDEPPTARQLHDLAVYAWRNGEEPPEPKTRGEAARQLHIYKRRPKQP